MDTRLNQNHLPETFNLHQYLSEQSFALDKDNNGNVNFFRTNEAEVFLNYIDMVMLARDITKTRGKLFKMEKSKLSRNNTLISIGEESKRLLNILQSFSEHEICRYRAVFKFNPWISILLIALARKKIRHSLDGCSNGRFMGDAQLKSYVDTLNDIVHFLRVQTKKRQFLEAHKTFIRRSIENHHSIRNFCNDLFEIHEEVYICRMDFAYAKTSNKWFQNDEPLDNSFVHIKKDLEKFIRCFRKKEYACFDSLLAYIWKLEVGVLKGAQCHVIFCLDARKIKDANLVIEEIGNVWKMMSHAYGGITLNCARWTNSLKSVGTGLIHASNYAKREQLNNIVLPYLTQMETLLKAKNLGKTLGISAIKEATK